MAIWKSEKNSPSWLHWRGRSVFFFKDQQPKSNMVVFCSYICITLDQEGSQILLCRFFTPLNFWYSIFHRRAYNAIVRTCLFEISFVMHWHAFDTRFVPIVVTPNVKGVKNAAPIRSVHSRPILFAEVLSAHWQRFLFAYWKCTDSIIRSGVESSIQKIQGLCQIFFQGRRHLFPGGR